MAFKKWSAAFVIRWNKLKWTVVWGKCQKCKLYLCTMQSLFQATVSSISRVQSTIERVYKRSRKTKLWELSKIIHQKLPIFDKNFFIKLRKTWLSLKFLEQKEFVCRLKTELSYSCTSFARRLKKFSIKPCAEFYCRQIAEKVISEIPAIHY